MTGAVLEEYLNSTGAVQEQGKPDARSHLRACAKPFQNRSHFSLQNGTPYPPNFLLSLTASTILEQYWSNTSAATGVVLHWCSTGRLESTGVQCWKSIGTVLVQCKSKAYQMRKATCGQVRSHFKTDLISPEWDTSPTEFPPKPGSCNNTGVILVQQLV